MATSFSSKFKHAKASNDVQAQHTAPQSSSSQRPPSAPRPPLTAEERRLASQRRLRLIEDAIAEQAILPPVPPPPTKATTKSNYRIKVTDGPFSQSTASSSSSASSNRMTKPRETHKSSGTADKHALADSFAKMTVSSKPATKANHPANEKRYREHNSTQSQKALDSRSSVESSALRQQSATSNESISEPKSSKTPAEGPVPSSPSKTSAIQPRPPVTDLSREQTRILKLVESGESVFYTGSAGKYVPRPF